MKLTWKARAGVTGVSPVVLGDDSIGRGPGCKAVIFATPNFSQILQVAAYPDADEIEVFGRKNVSTSYRFAVHYEFATYNACLAWQHDLGLLLESEGVLSVQFSGGGLRSLTGGWQEIAPSPMGTSCRIEFTFLGGAFTPQSATGL